MAQSGIDRNKNQENRNHSQHHESFQKENGIKRY